jgi:hypothetical protein
MSSEPAALPPAAERPDAAVRSSVAKFRPGWPRKPGTYPAGYSAQRQFAKIVPTPGEPPDPEWGIPDESADMPELVENMEQPQTEEVPDAVKKYVNKKLFLTARSQKINLVTLQSSSEDFPPVTVPPGKFRIRPLQYPSGASTGTDLFRPFEERIRAMFVEQATAKPR